MKTERLQNNHWDGYLTIENAADVQAEITRRLLRRWVTVVVDNPSITDLEIYSDQTVVAADTYLGKDVATVNIRFDQRRFAFETFIHERSGALSKETSWYITLNGDDIRLRRQYFGKNDEPFRIAFVCSEQRENT